MKIVGGVHTADLIMRKTPLNGLKSSLLYILSNQGDGDFDTLSSALSSYQPSWESFSSDISGHRQAWMTAITKGNTTITSHNIR